MPVHSRDQVGSLSVFYNLTLFKIWSLISCFQRFDSVFKFLVFVFLEKNDLLHPKSEEKKKKTNKHIKINYLKNSQEVFRSNSL